MKLGTIFNALAIGLIVAMATVAADKFESKGPRPSLVPTCDIDDAHEQQRRIAEWDRNHAGSRVTDIKVISDSKTSYPCTVITDLTDEEYREFKKWREERNKPKTLFHLNSDETAIVITHRGQRVTGKTLNALVLELDQSDEAKRAFDRAYVKATKIK